MQDYTIWCTQHTCYSTSNEDHLHTCASVHVIYLTLTHNLQQKVVTLSIKECILALHDITELNHNMSQSVSAGWDQSDV